MIEQSGNRSSFAHLAERLIFAPHGESVSHCSTTQAKKEGRIAGHGKNFFFL